MNPETFRVPVVDPEPEEPGAATVRAHERPSGQAIPEEIDRAREAAEAAADAAQLRAKAGDPGVIGRFLGRAHRKK